MVVITGAGGLTDKIDESLRSLVATAKGGSVVESDLVRLWGGVSD